MPAIPPQHNAATLSARHAQTLDIRQSNSAEGYVIIPANYQNINNSPSPGAVVGIVLGSVAGFLLLLFLFSSLNGNNWFGGGGSDYEEEVVVRRRSESGRSRRSSRRPEMSSRGSPRTERIIRQERVVRDTSRAPPIPRNTFVVEDRGERRVDGDDIVEVIEEEGSSIAPRRKSKRGSQYR